VSDGVDLKLPPFSIQAEQSVIGGLMLDNSRFDEVADKVSVEDFYRKDHALIFKAIVWLAKQDKPFDVITISDFLQSKKKLDEVGGLAYLGLMAKDTPSAANVVNYADIVREKSVLRRLICINADISEMVFNPDGRDSKVILEAAESKIYAISESSAKKSEGLFSVKHFLGKAVDKIETLFDEGGGLSGLSCGFSEIDKITDGLQRADLIILAARPSMGKTSLAMNMAEHVAIHEKKKVAVFSLEMPGEGLSMRMMSSLGRINQNNVRSGRLEEDEWARLTGAINLLSECELFIDDEASLSTLDIRSRLRRIIKDFGSLDLVIIDYLQLIKSINGSDNRNQDVSDISRELKAIAKDFNVPLVVLSQLNRNLESRGDKRPMMSDLRDSGAIEQDADLIIFLYRDEIYHEDSEFKGVAEAIIAKQRNGAVGTCRLSFFPEFTRFENFANNQ